MKPISILATSLALTFLPGHLPAQDSDVLDPDSWPRSYKVGNSEFAVYMPQLLEWTEYRHLKGTAAIAVKLEGSAEATFGAASIEADTVADFEHHSVRLGKRTLGPFRFPELDEENARKAEQLVRSVLTPDAPLELPLAAFLSAVERADAITGDTTVNLDPPPIYYSDAPAILVIFIGDPKLQAVDDDDPALMFALNTNWDVLFDSTSGSYYVLVENQWMTTKDLVAGAWSPATVVPESFQKLPADENWSQVKAHLFIAGDPAKAPKVFVSTRPAEIILTDGKSQLGPISGTSLMYIANTESDLFYHPAQKNYYFLTAGRWFSAPSLDGPWAAATEALPDDFAKIPPGHPKSHVLASVKGTSQADEAVILASIPQTATVDRASAVMQVPYEGEPQFKSVPGTQDVSFAINTSYDVFLVSNRYYCCHQGVWFEAPAPTGNWKVCDNVPQAIYSIPPQSPKHNVTYVHVYDSTPETVQVGVTSGYSGSYIAAGLVVFGLGYWLGQEAADRDYWYGPYYPSPHWYGYGCGAYYRPGSGYYRRGASYYGPYGGAGYGAAYNPVTGSYARGAYAYGPRGAAGAKAAYNPWTNTTAGRVGVSTPYGSWGRSAVVRDDEWIRAGHRSNPYGTVGGIQTSKGGAAVGIDRRYGSDALVARSGSGDVYVGKDGNVYKKNADGGWQKRQDGGWQGAPDIPRATPYQSRSGGQASTTPAAQPRPTQPRQPAQPRTRPSTQPRQPASLPARSTNTSRTGTGYTNRGATPSQLSRDSYSRQRASSGNRSSRGTRSSANGRSGGLRRR